MTTLQSPAGAGFFMPAEWHPHRRTWMMWPTRSEIWPDIDAVRLAYAEVARTIRRFEPVTMAANAGDVAAAKALLGPDIEVVAIPVDDSWARDAGPCFLVDGRGNRAGAAFRFNAWGDKYEPHDRDAAFAAAVLDREGLPCVCAMVAEGGGISVDGEGTILTTGTCFPNANRNPGWSREAISAELKRMLGGTHVVWLPGNAVEVETDGHVDCVAVFARPGVVLVEEAGEPGSEHDRIMRENHRALSLARDARGRPFELVKVPEAADAEAFGERFCRSYVNSYFVNGGVVIPAYGTPTDAIVRDIFARVFPDREVAQVAVSAIAEGGGGIHCITQQEPEA